MTDVVESMWDILVNKHVRAEKFITWEALDNIDYEIPLIKMVEKELHRQIDKAAPHGEPMMIVSESWSLMPGTAEGVRYLLIAPWIEPVQ